MHGKQAKHTKNRAPMIRTHSHRQLSLAEFDWPFQTALDENKGQIFCSFYWCCLVFVGAAVDANWTQRFLPPESFMYNVFPLASLLLLVGVIVLSESENIYDIMLNNGSGS